LQTPLMQTEVDAHGRPSGSPHTLVAVSHTQLAQTRISATTLHLEFRGGLAGIGSPLGTFVEHDPPPASPSGLLHQPPRQSKSTVQADPHWPVASLQMPPACVPVAQSRFDAHLTHVPSAEQ
jgi:hypothetical protein